ncbi:hypothetical protein [Salinimicrobium sp. GXAS 041]
MINYRFTYKAENKEVKKDILIEAENEKDAISAFKFNYPNLVWVQTWAQ